MRVITLLFATLVVTIILLANNGWLGAHLGWLYTLPGGDKLAHFLLIGTLAGLAELSVGGHQSRVIGYPLPTASIVVTVLVVMEEVSQLWLPTRTFSLIDLGANVAGIIVIGGMARTWVANVATDPPGKF